jgi:hypothetical protein
MKKIKTSNTKHRFRGRIMRSYLKETDDGGYVSWLYTGFCFETIYYKDTEDALNSVGGVWLRLDDDTTKTILSRTLQRHPDKITELYQNESGALIGILVE